MDKEANEAGVRLLVNFGATIKFQERAILVDSQKCSVGIRLNSSMGHNNYFGELGGQPSTGSLENAMASSPSLRVDNIEAKFQNLKANRLGANGKASQDLSSNHTNPWKHREFVKLNLVDKCKALAADGISINFDVESMDGNTSKLQKVLVGKLMV